MWILLVHIYFSSSVICTLEDLAVPFCARVGSAALALALWCMARLGCAVCWVVYAICCFLRGCHKVFRKVVPPPAAPQGAEADQNPREVRTSVASAVFSLLDACNNLLQ